MGVLEHEASICLTDQNNNNQKRERIQVHRKFGFTENGSDVDEVPLAETTYRKYRPKDGRTDQRKIRGI